MQNFCVYTAITGNYETLLEELPPNESKIPFICLTDNPQLRSDSWEIRYVPGFFSNDPMRNQRVLKIEPHKYLSDFDCSLYIDNSVKLIKDPSEIFDEIFKDKAAAFFLHSYRSTVYEEFIAVMRAGLDGIDRINEQLLHYENSNCYEILFERPYWGGMIFRSHTDARVKYFSEVWIAHVLRYARRDQLSLNYALRVSGLLPFVIEYDIRDSDFHRWPRLDINRVTKKKPTLFIRLLNKIYAKYHEKKWKNLRGKVEL